MMMTSQVCFTFQSMIMSIALLVFIYFCRIFLKILCRLRKSCYLVLKKSGQKSLYTFLLSILIQFKFSLRYVSSLSPFHVNQFNFLSTWIHFLYFLNKRYLHSFISIATVFQHITQDLIKFTR